MPSSCRCGRGRRLAGGGPRGRARAPGSGGDTPVRRGRFPGFLALACLLATLALLLPAKVTGVQVPAGYSIEAVIVAVPPVAVSPLPAFR